VIAVFNPPLRRAIFHLVRMCARVKPPPTLDRAATRAAVLAIRAYRRVLSPLIGRDCLFQQTCSRFAEEALTRHGWRAGWREAQQRLEDCGGAHAMLVLADGTRRMRAASGRLYDEALLAEDGARK
jgi:putative component of membrane protein insertase Oxa1/YidC/SpoIIIJ protein YidD